MQEKTKEPEIRFAGFTGAWEQRKLSDIAERITRKNTHLESTLPLTISSSYGLIDQYAYFNNRVASRNTRNYYLIKNGEFAYNKSYSDGFPFGSVKRLDRYAMGVLSTLYIIFSIDYRKVNSDFLVSYYDTKNWHHQVALRAAEGARNHGLLNISADDFFETELKIPMDLDEQKKIGSFFVQLNSFITLHQRKYEKLLNIKKSMLEKMFPKEGEVVPEIRFKGFTGAWEQRKLSDGMTEYTDRVFIEDDQIYKQVTVKNTGEISLRGSQPGRNIGRKRQARVNLRDYPMTLIFTRQTVEQGGIGFAKNDVDGCIVTENMPTIAVDGKKFNQDFLVAFFKTYGFRKDVILSNIEGGTAQIAIHEDDILDSSSTFPSLKEQIKIGNFFRTLSQQITLHQRQSVSSDLLGASLHL